MVNEYLWDGDWYARGITDDNVVFGISTDQEGRIFINPQGWALLSGAADEEKQERIDSSRFRNSWSRLMAWRSSHRPLPRCGKM